jgi:type II secretory pathway pseudopilin PulG
MANRLHRCRPSMLLTPQSLYPVQRHLRNGGFTYLGLLILIAIIGIASAATMQVGSLLQRREAEEELLDIGAAFRAALISYANATPLGQQRAPNTLQDLLKDPRYPNTVRHLRTLYADPLTGKQEWGTITYSDGKGIAAVYSLSEASPIKIGNFDPPFQEFAGKALYRDWKFMISLQVL